MAEETTGLDSSATVSVEEIPHNETSVEATVQSDDSETTDSVSNNIETNNAEVSDDEPENSIEFADEFSRRGKKALKDNDYGEAVDCLSRALEIRVALYGELGDECVTSYYEYGRALLYKAQEEADPLGTVPKKEVNTQPSADKEASKDSSTGESVTTASVASNDDQVAGSNRVEEAVSNFSSSEEVADVVNDEEESDADDLAEGEDDESDLDLAWKMLDVARIIAEKYSGDTIEKVEILSALAEVALEREDIETSLSDYEKALSMLERLVEPDSRHIAELNFRICLCLEIGSKPKEATSYCEKAVSVCKLRLDRLINETKSNAGSATSSADTGLDEAPDSKTEIETLTGLLGELEKKLEDLQTLAQDPRSIVAELLGMASNKVKAADNPASASTLQIKVSSGQSNADFKSPTTSTAHTNGATTAVTHLGVVGRGVKRMSATSISTESSSTKKPALEPLPEDGN